MPDTGPAPLPEAQMAALQRWNPGGASILRQVSAGTPASAVYFTGPESTELSAELRARVPDLAITSDLGQATVAVVALRASAPPSADSIKELRTTAAAGAHLLLAMTGIDRSRDWRDVRSATTDLLLATETATEAPQIWPVAPRLGTLARTTAWDDPAAGHLASACSGLAELQGALSELLSQPSIPNRAATVRATVITEALRRIAKTRQEIASTSADEALRAERSRLALRRDGGRAEATTALRSAIALARVELLHDAGAQVRAVNTTARDEVDSSDRKVLARYPDRLQEHISVLARNTGATTTARLAAIARQAGLSAPPDGPGLEVSPGPGPEPRRAGLEDQMILVTGASAGVGIGRLAVSPLSLTPALDYATWPATLLLGGGAAWWITRSRKQLSARAAMRQWINDALVNVKGQLEQQIAATIVRTETALTSQISKQSAVRTVEVDARLAAIDTELRTFAARRQAQAQACDRDRAALAK